ncbi:hypothetical protein CPB83DRAFT_863661 [Crepidotus variabilis]|uniref:Secreted protein n=1 Tax=Crepidotus variabilis TaxID=179855 RepID=A0A9P6E5P9_9AGAR|nr:hypothetical protein CPB83DRAFT_863661 [Crepidotus variabilis]
MAKTLPSHSVRWCLFLAPFLWALHCERHKPDLCRFYVAQLGLSRFLPHFLMFFGTDPSSLIFQLKTSRQYLDYLLFSTMSR